jgi:hypothetical protein
MTDVRPPAVGTTEDALWMAVGAAPGDQLPRLVLADWLEENPGFLMCPVCPPDEGEEPHTADILCERCGGGRRVPDGRADTAAGLRATAGKVPQDFRNRRISWARFSLASGHHDEPCLIADDVCDRLGSHLPPLMDSYVGYWFDYPTAEAAIRDLVAAWCTVERGATG